MHRGAVVMISLAVLGGAAACGGDSDSAETASPTHDEAHASTFRKASVLLGRYCLKDPYDGIEREEADAALDTLIGIAKAHPDEEYIPAVSYGEWLTNPGIDDLRACDPVFTVKLDQAIAELN